MTGLSELSQKMIEYVNSVIDNPYVTSDELAPTIVIYCLKAQIDHLTDIKESHTAAAASELEEYMEEIKAWLASQGSSPTDPLTSR